MRKEFKQNFFRLSLVTIIFITLLTSVSSVFAEYIIINSKDWKDVYSGMQYGYLTGKKPTFLTSEKHSTIILNDIPKNNEIVAYSSRKSPFVVGYKSILESKGYKADEIIFKSLSIELARELTNINKYIILDDNYGYNAIAVAPYAIISNSFVLFADKTNINEIVNFLDSKNPESILIYGTVEREVRDKLKKYNPEIINNDGDRFANNVEIVKRYKKIKNVKQVFMTNGEFIEDSLMSGEYPTLFIGIQNVPDKVREYIAESDLEVGVLIGNELVGTATYVRRNTGLSTFVKFARSAREPTGAVASIEGLDIFRLPKYELNITVKSIRYNALTKQIEVTIENLGEVAVYFRGTYTVTINSLSYTFGDIQAIFIDGKDIKTILYDIEPLPDEGNISATFFILFGESKNSLERRLDGSLKVDRVQILDDTAITIEKLVYDKSKKRLIVYVKNIGPVETYVKTEAVDMLIIDEYKTYASEKTILLSPGKSGKSNIHVDLSEEDLENNPKIRIRAYYGQREDALVKVLEGDFEVSIRSVDIWTYVPLLIIILLILLIIFGRKRKKKKHQD